MISDQYISFNIGELLLHSKELLVFDIAARYDSADDYVLVAPDDLGGTIIQPGMLLLGKTLEKITTPANIVGFIEERRTTAGNLGLVIKGFIPPGLKSEQVRFTLQNHGTRPVRVYLAKVPPMKAVFHSLSSTEVYGQNRDTRVARAQVYSSGAGEIGEPSPGVVLTTFSFDPAVKVGQILNVNFRLENTGQEPVNKTTIYPLLNQDVFIVTSCSPGWHLNLEKTPAPPQPSLLRKAVPQQSNSLGYDVDIAPQQIVQGTFGVRFKTSLALPQLKFETVCQTHAGARFTSKCPMDFPNLSVEGKRPIITGDVFRAYFIPAILGAILYGIAVRIGPSILDFLKYVLDILFQMIG